MAEGRRRRTVALGQTAPVPSSSTFRAMAPASRRAAAGPRRRSGPTRPPRPASRPRNAGCSRRSSRRRSGGSRCSRSASGARRRPRRAPRLRSRRRAVAAATARSAIASESGVWSVIVVGPPGAAARVTCRRRPARRGTVPPSTAWPTWPTWPGSPLPQFGVPEHQVARGRHRRRRTTARTRT